MKKSIKYLLGAAIVVPALVSCSDFLDQNPDLRTTLDSEEKIANILVSAYVSGAGSYQLVAELSSDNVCDHGIKKDYNQFYQDVYEWAEEVTSNNDAPRNIWSTNYKNIANANQALAAIEELAAPPRRNSRPAKAKRSCAAPTRISCWRTCSACPTIPQRRVITWASRIWTTPKPTSTPNTSAERSVRLREIGLDIEEGIPLLDDTSYSVAKYHFNYKAAWLLRLALLPLHSDWDNATSTRRKVLTSNPSRCCAITMRSRPCPTVPAGIRRTSARPAQPISCFRPPPRTADCFSTGTAPPDVIRTVKFKGPTRPFSRKRAARGAAV